MAALLELSFAFTVCTYPVINIFIFTSIYLLPHNIKAPWLLYFWSVYKSRFCRFEPSRSINVILGNKLKALWGWQKVSQPLFPLQLEGKHSRLGKQWTQLTGCCGLKLHLLYVSDKKDLTWGQRWRSFLSDISLCTLALCCCEGAMLADFELWKTLNVP